MSARLTPREMLLRSVTEAQWQSIVEAIATARGWRWYHAPDNVPKTSKNGKRFVQNIRAGFPDIVCVRGPRLIFAELKREGPAGTVSAEQTAWLEALIKASAEVYVWRPSDQREVEETLR